jgi:hypothetical protein
MVTTDWHQTTSGDVTLVQVAVRSDSPRAVRVENSLPGPVWPPRSRGRAETGWDEDGYSGTVGPEGPLVLGYATPADPGDPPVTVEDRGTSDGVSGAVTPADVVRALGETGPPLHAVPQTVTDGAGPDGLAGRNEDLDPAVPDPGGHDEVDPERRDVHAGPTADVRPPDAVLDWLDEVAARVERAERCATDGPSEPDGTVPTDQGTAVATDRAALDRVRREARALTDRIETVEPEAEGPGRAG